MSMQYKIFCATYCCHVNIPNIFAKWNNYVYAQYLLGTLWHVIKCDTSHILLFIIMCNNEPQICEGGHRNKYTKLLILIGQYPYKCIAIYYNLCFRSPRPNKRGADGRNKKKKKNQQGFFDIYNTEQGVSLVNITKIGKDRYIKLSIF